MASLGNQVRMVSLQGYLKRISERPRNEEGTVVLGATIEEDMGLEAFPQCGWERISAGLQADRRRVIKKR